jgi:hypothetical protein
MTKGRTMKRGDKVTATITGTLLGKPSAGMARISVPTEDGKQTFWCVVPAHLVESVEE